MTDEQKKLLEEIENQLYAVNARNISLRWIGMRQTPTMDEICNLNSLLGFIIKEIRTLRETGELDIDKLHDELFSGRKNLPVFQGEIVVCAAIKTRSGKVFNGHRHDDAIYAANKAGYTLEDLSYADQGFVTTNNRYVTREEGRKLQDAAGIKSVDKEGYRGTTLFSEDLY